MENKGGTYHGQPVDRPKRERLLGKLGLFRAVADATMPEQRKDPAETLAALEPRRDANWIGE